MQIHGGFQSSVILAPPSRGADDRCVRPVASETLLNRMPERGMRAYFQPYIHGECSEGIHGGRELHRLPDAASPVSGIARLAPHTGARNRAEKRDNFALRLEIGE